MKKINRGVKYGVVKYKEEKNISSLLNCRII